ncbi:transposase family protein [Streptomyces sp. NBC_01236]|uniref:transposase family protein n=1 Tax=Streptomyces sp. NBC_01236 TaxID=2903789 RepID=UPI002E13D5D8|nr:transposase family protein [Streptomyces sp. NBC_01236]
MPTARCPICGVVSWRVHGRYVRQLADAPVSGAPLVIELVVRRFKCLNPKGPATTFAEQIAGLTSPVHEPGSRASYKPSSPYIWPAQTEDGKGSMAWPMPSPFQGLIMPPQSPTSRSPRVQRG